MHRRKRLNMLPESLNAVEIQNTSPPSAMESHTSYLELGQPVQHADGVGIGDAGKPKHDPLQ